MGYLPLQALAMTQRRYPTDIPSSPDADDSTVLDHGHADIFRVGSAPRRRYRDPGSKRDATATALHALENVLQNQRFRFTDIPATLPGALRICPAV